MEDENQGSDEMTEEEFGSVFAVCWDRMELFWTCLSRNTFISRGSGTPRKL